MPRILSAVFAALLLAPTVALAQGGLLQAGPATSGHAAKFLQNGVVGDGGPAAGGAAGSGLSELGVTNTGNGICQNTGPTTGPYSQLCLGFNSGNGQITLQGYGGQTPSLSFVIDGVTYPYPLPATAVFNANVMSYGAIGDGNTHPLSSKYSTLAAARVFCPAATALTNEIDWCAATTAQATGLPIYLPANQYVWSDKLTLNNAQCIYGDERTKSVVNVNAANFNMSATGVIVAASSETGACIRDMGVYFLQPNSALRSAMNQYPPAIYAQGASRFTMSRVRISGAWAGIDMRGTQGGAYVDDVEVGAMSYGLWVDGAQDFTHINQFHDWVFGIPANAITGVYPDGNTTCMNIGRADGFAMNNVSCFEGKINILSDATFVQGTNVELDSDPSDLTIAGGNVQMNGVYLTGTGADLGNKVLVTGGTTTLSNVNLVAANANANGAIYVSGGTLMIRGGTLFYNNANYPMAFVAGTGAVLDMDAVYIQPGGAHTYTMIYQGSTGILRLTNSRIDPMIGSDTVYIASTDVTGNFIVNNDFGQWGQTIGTNYYKGVYGPNRALAFQWVPTVSFSGGNGTFAPTYTVQQGYYWYEPGGIRFEAVISFNSGAYSGASGQLMVNAPISATNSGITQRDIHVDYVNNVTLDSGYSWLGGAWSSAGFQLIENGSAQTVRALSPGNIPVSTGVQLSISGFIPT